MSNSTRPTVEKLHQDTEDDLDDLDDVLDQFSAVQKPSSLQAEPQSPISSPPAPPPTATTTTTFGRPRNNTRVDVPPSSIPGSGLPLDTTAEVDEDELSSEFAKELAKGMEGLMQEIAGDVDRSATGDDATDEERARAFKAAWEAMLVEGMDGQTAGEVLEDKGKPSASKDKAAPAGDFKDIIKQAMGQLKETESNLRTNSNDGGAGLAPESVEALIKSLSDIGVGEGGETDADIAGFLESMMGQLMNKEILYEPVKELAVGFPSFLATPPQPLSAADKSRYERQLACARRIVAVFEDPTYSDSNPENNKAIIELMSELQTYGAPPSELTGPLQELDYVGNIPGTDENCVIT